MMHSLNFQNNLIICCVETQTEVKGAWPLIISTLLINGNKPKHNARQTKC